MLVGNWRYVRDRERYASLHVDAPFVQMPFQPSWRYWYPSCGADGESLRV
jgi:hypothetical protein